MGNFGFIRLTMARIRGKPPLSPIYYSVRLSASPTSETVPIWTLAILQDYNSLFRPLIGMKFEENL
jgi:hypothetical protein